MPMHFDLETFNEKPCDEYSTGWRHGFIRREPEVAFINGFNLDPTTPSGRYRRGYVAGRRERDHDDEYRGVNSRFHRSHVYDARLAISRG